MDFVEGMGLKVEGIYRVPGKKENCLLLQDKFEEGNKTRMPSGSLCVRVCECVCGGGGGGGLCIF